MKKVILIALAIALFSLFSANDVQAFVHQYSPSPLTAAAQSGYSYFIDEEGRYFFYRPSATTSYPVKSFDASGELLFQSGNLLLSPQAKYSSDDAGNLHYVRVLHGYPTNYQQLRATKINNTGALDYQDKPIFDSMMSHTVQDLFFNYSTNSLILNIGEDEFGIRADKYKSVQLDENANPLTPINSSYTTNPYSNLYCSNREPSFMTVPYDVANWSQCWDWCDANMDSTYALCQYNADGPRNCWMNEAPAGGVNNCVWENWPAAGWPPYTGYYGMPDPITEAFNVPVYATAYAYPFTHYSTIEKIVDDNFTYLYFYLSSDKYVQKLNANGEPVFSGSGINLSGMFTGNITDIDVINGEIYVSYVQDTNSDYNYDTLYIQKLDVSGNPVFPGNGILIYEDLVGLIDIWSYIVAKDDKLLIAISEYETDTWTYINAYFQVMSPDGTLIHPGNGEKFLDYTTNDFQPYYVDRSMKTASGEMYFFISGYDTLTSTEEIRLYVPQSDGAIKYADYGLVMDYDDTYSYCSEDILGNMSCVESDETGDKFLRHFDKAYQIRPSASFTVIDSLGRNISANKTYGVGPEILNRVVDIDLVTPDNIVAVELTAQVNVDRDWSAVDIDLDAALGKMFVSGLDGASGVISNRTVYVPITVDSNPNRVRFCPNATTFVGITTDCAGGFTYDVDNVNASIVEIEELDYWKIDNLGEDGGFVSYFATAPVDEEETPPDDDDDIPPAVVDKPTPTTYPPVGDTDPSDPTEGDEDDDESPTDEDGNNGEEDGDNDGSGSGDGSADGKPGNETGQSDDKNEDGFIAGIIDGISSALEAIGENAEKVFNSDVAKTASVIMAPILYLAISPMPVGFREGLAIVIRGYNGFLALLAPKKKLSIFGYVYDSVTKAPLSLAVVRFFNKSGGLVVTSVTNSFGRFNIDLPTDSYKAVVSHTGYKFPSQVVKGLQDSPIANLYHGEFQDFDRSKINTISVPLDSSEKHGLDISLITAKSALGKFITGLLWVLFGFGFVQSIYLLFVEYSLWRVVMVLFYVLLTVYYIVTSRKVSAGKATYRGEFISNLEVTLSKDIEGGEILDKRFTDDKGHFNFVALKGEYYINVRSDKYELAKPIRVSVDSPRPVSIGALLELRRKIAS